MTSTRHCWLAPGTSGSDDKAKEIVRQQGREGKRRWEVRGTGNGVPFQGGC